MVLQGTGRPTTTTGVSLGLDDKLAVVTGRQLKDWRRWDPIAEISHVSRPHAPQMLETVSAAASFDREQIVHLDKGRGE